MIWLVLLKVHYGLQHPIYFKNASAGLYRNYKDIEACALIVLDKVIKTPGLIYQINTLGGKINSPQFQQASAYAHRHLPFLSELQAYWDEPKEEKNRVEAFEEIQKHFFENDVKAHYTNYPDLNFRNWREAYYGNNYERLLAVKKSMILKTELNTSKVLTFKSGICLT